jgi:hypothetical protein
MNAPAAIRLRAEAVIRALRQPAIAALSAPRPDVWSDVPCAEALTTPEKQP